MKNNKVEVYISDDCGDECDKLIQFFEKRDITYTLNNISNNPTLLEKLREHNVYITPVTFFGESEYIFGYQHSKLEDVFGS